MPGAMVFIAYYYRISAFLSFQHFLLPFSQSVGWSPTFVRVYLNNYGKDWNFTQTFLIPTGWFPDFGVPLIFHLGPPAGQRFLLSWEILWKSIWNKTGTNGPRQCTIIPLVTFNVAPPFWILDFKYNILGTNLMDFHEICCRHACPPQGEL